MGVQESINQKYTNLCAQLGSLTVQKMDLDAKVTSIKGQIEALNSLVPDMLQLEKGWQANKTAGNVAPQTGNANVKKTKGDS